MLAIPFPPLDPNVFSLGPFAVHGWSLGPFAVRWYALAYIAGLIIGWRYCLALAKKPPQIARPQDIDDFLVWATIGVILGGRIGYVLFYNLDDYLAHPADIFKLWRGGMSFHGGALGVLVAIVIFCRQRGIAVLGFADIIACAVPIGLFFGRLANFVNGELWGRPSDVPWAMQFPMALLTRDDQAAGNVLKTIHDAYPQLGLPDAILTAYRDNPQLHALLLQVLIPRHPSQLYEAFLEGIVLFTLLWALQRFTPARRHPGMLTGVFLIGYGTARIIAEFFREPDQQLGFLWNFITMGQLLSIPVLLFGVALLVYARRSPAVA